PGAFCCYGPPEGVPLHAELPGDAAGCVTFGSLHKLEKLNAGVVDLWCAVLRDVPGARLLLARTGLRGAVAEHWRGEFDRRGGDPGGSRAGEGRRGALGPRRVYGGVAVALAPSPGNGPTTACEALWMGVPVVALRGGRHAGRMAASVLTHAGLGELVAGTPD